MGSGFNVPPTADFQAYSKLVDQQGSHLSAMATWSGKECSAVDGLDGLLDPLRGLVPKIGSYFQSKFDHCQSGMSGVSQKVTQARTAYADTDKQAEANLKNAYPTPIPGFQVVSYLPGLGSFDDTAVSLQEPDSAGDDTSKNIKLQLKLASGKLVGGELKGAATLFRFFTGQDLIELLFQPIFGEWGRLKYLEQSYEQLSAAAYTVAGTLRKGTWQLGSEWQGDAGTAFDSYLFRWSMGIGGLGDAAKVAAKLYTDGYAAVCVLVFAAIKAINDLLENGVQQLAEEAATILGGDAAIETVGGGPEDPVADVGAIVLDIWEMYKIYKTIRTIISVISTIETIFHDISAAITKIESDAEAVERFFTSPLPSLRDITNYEEQKVATFENNPGWNPELGALRIGLLP
jgi:uncharacterized protein YukE